MVDGSALVCVCVSDDPYLVHIDRHRARQVTYKRRWLFVQQGHLCCSASNKAFAAVDMGQISAFFVRRDSRSCEIEIHAAHGGNRRDVSRDAIVSRAAPRPISSHLAQISNESRYEFGIYVVEAIGASPEQIEFRAETRKQLYTWQNACEQAAARFIDQ